jgi:hypothetical protein
MPTRKQNQNGDNAAKAEELDSPTILNLIEQLDNDIVEANLSRSKTQLRAQAL